MTKDFSDKICGIVLEAVVTSSNEELQDENGFWTKEDDIGRYTCKLDTFYNELLNYLRTNATNGTGMEFRSFEQVKAGSLEGLTKKGLTYQGCAQVNIIYHANEHGFVGDEIRCTIYLVDWQPIERVNEHTLEKVQRQKDILIRDYQILNRFTERELKFDEVLKFNQKEGKALEWISY